MTATGEPLALVLSHWGWPQGVVHSLQGMSKGQDIMLNKYSSCYRQDSGIGGQAADVDILILRRWALGNQLATFNYLTIFITLQLARQLLTVNEMPDDCKSAEGKKQSCSRNIVPALHTSALIQNGPACALRRTPADKL